MTKREKTAPSTPIETKRRKLRVCMLGYAFYESDPRIQQYATALLKRGESVDVIALKRDDKSPDFEIYNGVRLFRIQKRVRNERGMFDYVSRLSLFLFRATLLLWRNNRQQKYDLIHVHNVPDFLVFAAIGPKSKNVPIILDIHDVLPELYAAKFNLASNSFGFKLLAFVERCSVKFASHVIVANHLWRDRVASRTEQPDKCSVIRNYPDPDIFEGARRKTEGKARKFVLTYPGSLNAHQGVDVAIRAFARVANEIEDLEFHIYGDGPGKASLMELANSLGMQGRVRFHDPLPRRQIAQVMAQTDLAIEPKRSTSAFANEALSTKILEFMTLGIPVVASRTTIHAYYYDESIIQYYKNDDDFELARQIRVMRFDETRRQRLAARAKQFAGEHNWNSQKAEYLGLVDSLVQAD